MSPFCGLRHYKIMYIENLYLQHMGLPAIKKWFFHITTP